MCLPTLPKISDKLPETHLFFYLALSVLNIDSYLRLLLSP